MLTDTWLWGVCAGSMWVRHGVAMVQRTLQGWFDDRVESRNALSKLPLLNATPLDRKDLPWSCDPESDREERVDILMDTDVRQFKSGT